MRRAPHCRTGQLARRLLPALCCALLGLAPAGRALAQGVTLSGHMGAKALLVIDGQPQLLAVGETARGVRLLQFDGSQAQVERAGAVLLLRAGAPASVGAAAAGNAAASEIVIAGGPGGHFVTGGQINGRSVRFLVDTGATLVTLGDAEARRIGVDVSNGRRSVSQTANGDVPSVLVTLARVRVGEIEVANVAAVVLPAPMPHVLLGNSFLSRFQMRRDDDVMRLLPR